MADVAKKGGLAVGVLSAALAAGGEMDPWRKAYAHAIEANGLAGTPVEASVADHIPPWVETRDAPAWLGPEQLRAWAESWHDWAMSRTDRPGPELAEHQARLECLTDVLQDGLPPEHRGGWSVDLLVGRGGAGTAASRGPGTMGGRKIEFDPESAMRSAGVSAASGVGLRALAFVVAHEMAHNVARHQNKLLTSALVKRFGEEKGRAIAESTPPRALSKFFIRNAVSPDRALGETMEREADRGGLHILAGAGVPLDGARAWAKDHHDREADWIRSGDHAEPSIRRARIEATADRLDEMSARGPDPTHRCAEGVLDTEGWMKRVWKRLRRSSPERGPDASASRPRGRNAAGSAVLRAGRSGQRVEGGDGARVIPESASREPSRRDFGASSPAKAAPRAGSGHRPSVVRRLEHGRGRAPPRRRDRGGGVER